MGGFKDKDLIKDDCGLTKHREYGQNKRPPRMQQRKNQRERYLNKEEKRDMSAQELDFKLDDNGQVYVQEEPSANQVLTFGDIVQMPNDVKDIKQYHDYNVQLQQSLNDIGGGFGIQVNEETDAKPVQFDFVDTNIKQPQTADVSNDDLILSQEQQAQEVDPFDAIFEQNNSEETTQQEEVQEETTEETTQQEEVQEETTEETQQSNDPIDQYLKEQVDDSKSSEQKKEVQEETTEEIQQQSKDSIDQYLKMQIDDSKLSEQNKEKLDSFTSQQMDAFKKFLYQKRNSQE